MADSKISALPILNAVPAGETVWLVVVHNNVTKRIKLEKLIS